MTVKTSVTNAVNNTTKTFYSITNTIEEAVSRAVRAVEESTPIGQLPTKYQITVEVVD